MTSLRRFLGTLVPALVAGSLLTGCGSTKTVVAPARDTTLGKELTDLEDAYKKGIITEREYNRAKDRLLDGR